MRPKRLALLFAFCCFMAVGIVCIPFAFARAQEGKATPPIRPQSGFDRVTPIQATPRPVTFTASVNEEDNKRPLKAVWIGAQTFLDFKDVLDLLGFPIILDGKLSGAAGFFVSPDKKFILDVEDGALRIGAVRTTVDQAMIHKRDNRLYVEKKTLASWFGIAIEENDKQETLHLSTSFITAAQAKALRQKKREGLLRASAPPSTDLAPQTHDLRGMTGAGYEVELYRGDKLIAFQFADERGRYHFASVPLQYGPNAFRVLLYGPQGQYGEKSEQITTPWPSTRKEEAAKTEKAEETKKEKIVHEAKTAMAPASSQEKHNWPIQPTNWKGLTVERDGTEIGAIDAYIGAQGVFLRLDSFLRHAAIPFAQRINSSQFEIQLEGGKTLSLDLERRVYKDESGEHGLLANDAFKNEDIVYANTDLLYRLFPSYGFIVDQTQRKLNLPEPPKPAAVDQAHADLAPVPQAAPVVPVIVDDSSGAATVTGAPPSQPQPEGKDVLHIEEAQSGQDSSPPKEAKEEAKNGEPLILQPRLKKMAPSELFIEALDYGEQVYVPFGEMIQILDFPIKVEKDETEASGFFFSQEQAFKLNLHAKEVSYADKKATLTEAEVRRVSDRLYVNLAAFSEWFGVTCTIDRGQGILQITTDKLFPAEEAEARQKQWNKLLTAMNKKEEEFPVLQNPYRLFSAPSLDITLGGQHTHMTSGQNENPTVGSYNVQGAMDLGYMTSQLYLQGSSDTKAIQAVRFLMGREDPESSLLGVLGATTFSIGDVNSPSINFLTTSDQGRGAVISNRAIGSAENFDVRTLSGDSVPGYAVELYRNGVLMSFQTVDNTGRYSFPDVPILYGENVFRLVFYGPQGLTEERVETISASSAMLQKGKLEYTFGALEKGVPLLGQEKRALEATPNGLQWVGTMRYGLTSNYTVGLALAQTPLSDGGHRYASFTSDASFWGFLTETSMARDLETGGWASGLTVLTGFDGISLRARYRRFENFMSGSTNTISVPLRSEARFDANSQFYLPLIKGFSLGLTSLREEFVDPSATPRFTQGIQFSKTLWGLSFSNKLDYVFNGDRSLHDTFGIQTRIGNVNFRSTGIYDFTPEPGFRSASFAADYRLSEKMTAQSQIEQGIATRETSFSQFLNWDFDAFRLSLNNRFDNDGNYAVGMNIMFALNRNPLTGSWQMQPKQTASGGGIAGRVFKDDNANGTYDDGEALYPDAGVRVNRVPAKMDEGGYYVAPVAPYAPTKVQLSTDGAKDVLLTPATRGYRVLTRPGDVVIADFPLVATTIVDGTTTLLQLDGTRRDLGNIVVELQDKDLKPLRRIVSEVDGYFSFDKVQKGEYWIDIPTEVLSSLNAVLKEKIHLVIEDISEFVTGKELILEQKGDLTQPPDEFLGDKQKTEDAASPSVEPESQQKEEELSIAP